MRRSRSLFLLVLVAGIAGLAGLWYTSVDSTPGDEPAFGGAYVEGVIGAPARINPLFAAQNEVDAALVSLIFSGLTRLDERGQPFPDLAETWLLTPDGRTYTFTLRQGLIWQDGTPITSDDVLFTYGLLRAPGLRTTPALARVLGDATLRQLDARTLTIELPQAFAPLPAYLTLGILPAHLLRSVPPGSLFDAPFNQQPVGNGAYRLESLTPERAQLAANPGYHLGQPFIQRLELRFYRDEGALLAALRSRQIGGALFRSQFGETDRLYVEDRIDLRSTRLISGETAYVYFNLRLPMFEDRRLRQALLHALDRDVLIEETFKGQALKPDSPLVPESWAYSPSLRRYAFDPRVAGLLLDEAGWRMTDRGVRARGGQDLAFKLATNTDPQRVAVAQAIAQRWNALGARVTVEAGGTTTLVRDLLEPRSYEAALFAQVADPDPDPYLVWHSTQGSGKGANIGSLSNDRIDRVLAEARLNTPQTRRRELYAEFQEQFAQEVPAIPLYVSTALYVQPAGIQGARVRLLLSLGDRFWQVQEWHLKTR